MQFLRCVRAEFLLSVPRLVRTRLGLTMASLGGSLLWLNGHGFDALTVILVVGHEHDRAVLRTLLTHPTTALAIATGRWLAIVLPAAVLALACTVAVGGTGAELCSGLIAAAAVGSC